MLRCCDVYGKSASPKVCPLLTAAPSKRDHPPTINPSTGVESMPVLAITLTSRPTERRIYGQLLMAMGASINERLTLMELEIRTVLLLKSNNVRVLVFDEVHNLLAGTPREQRVILQLLRYLSNEIKASLVCLGVSEARDAIAGDTQLARRLDQFVLPRWKADEEFQELVTAILRSLPLRLPSSLSSQSLRHLSRLGDGITARVFGILNELAIEPYRTVPNELPMTASNPGGQPWKRKQRSHSRPCVTLQLRLPHSESQLVCNSFAKDARVPL